MEDNYEAIGNELVAKRKQLIELGLETLPPKIQGDFNEALIRNCILKYIDKKKYGVKQGIIYDNKGKTSKECDIIIYRKGKEPLFELGNLVVVNESDVAFVVEVKSSIDSGKMSEAISNLKEVKKLNNHIMCWIVAFKTKMRIKTLYRKARKSNCVQFLHVFQSEMIRKSNVLLENQMKFFIRAIRNCGVYSAYGYTKHFIIDRKEGKQPLILTEDNESNEEIFSKVESADFWESWEKGDIGYPEFERPHS
jgi:hypothetical protein